MGKAGQRVLTTLTPFLPGLDLLFQRLGCFCGCLIRAGILLICASCPALPTPVPLTLVVACLLPCLKVPRPVCFRNPGLRTSWRKRGRKLQVGHDADYGAPAMCLVELREYGS